MGIGFSIWKDLKILWTGSNGSFYYFLQIVDPHSIRGPIWLG